MVKSSLEEKRKNMAKKGKKVKEKVIKEDSFNCGGKDTTYKNLMKRVKELKEHGQEHHK